ncbi:tRNA pseudouridine(13) synthase TruD [Methanococcoides alaskense]|uniref:Probable tRNA pseudouridine synthase D n=1 Tax=Methanococcoides alaskense TaxID=325778 RepID=A0AA90Z6Z0_9EURY|nr:tRNA pseudouridine(13) synthase TruD [Methanococcoides alaskense]MDA0525177.1 tRNA pseudouridine(13) synthase TruD [Methanococcoides alaskense]MDR6221901.1 tRNA pseudouridine13 synthase [Methanococcoides alaskense]
MNNVPNVEKKIGIDLYTTKTPGIGGKLRQQTEDFGVIEITNREEGAEGKYLIVELTKRNWETHHLIRDLTRILRISQKRVGFAGTKDKRAVTTQKISIYDMDEEELQNVHLKDTELKILGRSNKSLELGDLTGNEFIITVRDIDIDENELESRLSQTTASIKEQGGVPNFFGIQRFGALRPITHVVGESIVRNDIEKAALAYIAASYPDEPEDTQQVRDRVFETRNYVEGLKEYPLQLRYERAMMHHLVSSPEDYAGSFETLPANIRKMFVHAYQSYIYNTIICTRIKKGLPLNRAVVGDIVCFKNKAGLPDKSRNERVTEDNIDGMNNLVRRNRAFVTAPLIGHSSELAAGVPGEIEREAIEELNVPIEGFKVPSMEELSSKGLRREILLSADPKYTIGEDELNEGKYKVTLDFSLPKGSYATTILREYMKVEPLKMS